MGTILGESLDIFDDVTGKWIGVLDRNGKEQVLLTYAQQVAVQALATTWNTANARRRPLIRSFSYVGTAAIREVDVGFQPDFVLIKDVSAGTLTPVWQTPATWYGRSAYLGVATGHAGPGIRGFSPRGFVVGNATPTNSAGVTYSCLALADNGSGKLRVGDYAGNGVDARDMSTVVGQDMIDDELVFWLAARDNTFDRWFRGKDSGEAMTMSTSNSSATVISSLAPLTISDADDVNRFVGDGSPGGHYSWLALYDCPEWHTSIEAGTGTARTISLPFSQRDKLAFALMRRLAVTSNNRAPQAMIPEASISTSFRPAEATFNASMITGNTSMALNVGGGNEVNSSGFDYFLLAMRQQMEGAEAQIIHPAYLGRAALKCASGGGILTQYAPAISGNAAFSVEFLGVLSPAMEGAIWMIASGAAVRSAGMITSDFATPAGSYPVYRVKTYDGAERNRDGGMVVAHNGLVHLVLFSDGNGDIGVMLNGRYLEQLTSSATIQTPADTKLSMLCCRDTADALVQSAVGSAMALLRVYSARLTNAQMFALYYAAIGAPGGAVPTFAEEWDAANAVGSTLVATRDRANDGAITNCTAVTV